MRTFIATLLVVSAFAGTVGAGSVAAGPDPAIITIGSGNEKTVTYGFQGSDVDEAVVTGPLVIVSEDRKSGNYKLRLRGQGVSGTKTGQVSIRLKNGSERRTKIRVAGSSSGISKAKRKDAKKYRNLKDNWVILRSTTKQRGGRVFRIYEYRDPTLGEINGSTGLPSGEWVEVKVDEDGNPKWEYTTVQGLLEYQTRKAHRNYIWGRNVVIGSGAVVALTFITFIFVIPKYKKKKKRSRWPSLGGGD